MTHTLHYYSADGPEPDATWSVYREQYGTPDTDVPIEGTQERVSTWPDEEGAQAEADLLQRECAARNRPNALPRIVNDDIPHIAYYNKDMHTNFLWTGRINDPIEVEEEYSGAPVTAHIEVPHMLSMTVLNGGSPPLVLRRFKDACLEWLENEPINVEDTPEHVAAYGEGSE